MTTTEIKDSLKPYCLVAKLVARIGGSQTEVVLHDLSHPLHSVVYVVNGHVTNRQVGQGLRHLVAEMLAAQAAKTDVLPDWWFRWEDKLIRCTTMLIRNAAGALIGALCVNMDVSEQVREFHRLQDLLPGLAAVEIKKIENNEIVWSNAANEKKSMTQLGEGEGVAQVVCRMIETMAKDGHMTGRSISAQERRAFVALLEERDIFLVKGALECTAKVLGVAKVTIYSDLHAIRKEGPSCP